jgi:hypothetical protein
MTTERYWRNAEMPPLNTKSVVPRWTRFCWWLSRKLGGRTVFGKRDETCDFVVFPAPEAQQGSDTATDLSVEVRESSRRGKIYSIRYKDGSGQIHP